MCQLHRMVSIYLLILLALCITPVLSVVHRQPSHVKSAYFYYGGGVTPTNIDTALFTHLYYAFASLDPVTYEVKRASDDTSGAISTFSATVRASNPSLKTLLSIGGGGSDATSFAAMAATRTGRAAFINSSITVARSFGFDGLDLDWEFPHSATDMANLAILLKEWRKAAKKQSPPLLLTAAVYYNVTLRLDGLGARSYPTAAIASYLDWVTLMTYDLHGSWEKTQTAQHTALYDNTTEQILTVNYGVQQWLEAQLPPSSALLGLAAYGYRWFLKDPKVHGVGAPTSDSDSAATFSSIQSDVRAAKGKCRVDKTTVAAYCYWTPPPGNTTLWAGFDNPTTIGNKVSYLRKRRLRGYSFWSIAGDIDNLLFKRGEVPILSHRISA